MNFFDKLIDKVEFASYLKNIEHLLVVNLVVLSVIAIVLIYLLHELNLNRKLSSRPAVRHVNPEGYSLWKEISNDYDGGDYASLINKLDYYEKSNKNIALIKFWKGRCKFMQNEWRSAVTCFEECCIYDPIYRKKVNEYMAFIELNNLVVGVNGYIEKVK